MAEEHRCQVSPEGPLVCTNNCGFFGSPAMLGLCSKCYRDFQLKEEEEASAKMAVEKSLLVSASEAPTTTSEAQSEPTPSAAVPVVLPAKQEPCSPPPLREPPAPSRAVQPGRCTSCRKRVGLTGFRCRCGRTFCGPHRYPEEHGCTFDFKSAGREEIARANPVVKAKKLHKI